MQYGICKIVSNLLLTYECMLYVCNKIIFLKKGTDFHNVEFDIPTPNIMYRHFFQK